MKKLPWILLGVAITAIPAAIAATNVFSDISEDDWYYEAVQNLQELGIVEGYEDGTYQAVNNVNRAEMAVMLDRMTETIRNGCIYEDNIFLDGDTIYEWNYEKAWCENGEIEVIMWDPLL